MDKFLLDAYKSTTYQVIDPKISLRIGEASKELDLLLGELNVSSFCFITAYNPFSKELSYTENSKRQVLLAEDLRSYKFFKGVGIPSDKAWSPEPSFLVVGISKVYSIELAKKYEQNAIVLGSIGQEAELLITV